MASATLADPTRDIQGTNRRNLSDMEESENDIRSLEQLLLYADEHYLAGKLPLGDHLGKLGTTVDAVADVPVLKEVHGKGSWIQDLLLQNSGNCLWNNCYAYVCSYCLTSHCGVHKCLPHDPSILSPRGLAGPSRHGFPRVGTFSCPLLPTISNGTLRTIHMASNTVRQPACSFHPDDQVSLKLA
ncbi:hypothetical protein TNCV_2440361 [Trichonephila clavipes]|nr:hypothetical protein TNCV_2440361 [Trichonephila clavipes]